MRGILFQLEVNEKVTRMEKEIGRGDEDVHAVDSRESKENASYKSVSRSVQRMDKLGCMECDACRGPHAFTVFLLSWKLLLRIQLQQEPD